MHVSLEALISEEKTDAELSVMFDDDPREEHPIGVRCENPRLSFWLNFSEAEDLVRQIAAVIEKERQPL